MDSIKQVAVSILDVSKKIFQINEKNNFKTIFKDKTFYIYGEEVITKHSDCKDSFYYFECPEVDGVIVKKENGAYQIKAAVKYINSEGKKWCFAKIRIDDYFGKININGRRTGSWEMPDFDDDNFIKAPDFELSLVLKSMYNSLCIMYDELNNGVEASNDKYIPSRVKRLIKYNNK